MGSIPGQGTKIPHAAWRGQKKKKKKRNNTYKTLSPGVGSYRPVFSAVAIIIDVVTIAGEFYPNFHQGQSQKN